MLFGYDIGVISGAILFIKKDFALSPGLAIVRQPELDRSDQPDGLCWFIRRRTGTGFLADPIGDLPFAQSRSGHERRNGSQLER